MPLRSLLYVASVYGAFVNWDALYRKKRVKIAKPYFVTFYNGPDAMPERQILRLSDAYETPAYETMPHIKEPMLELEVLVLNINKGYNKELMDKCSLLRDYATFVSKVRKNQAIMKPEDAVEQAIEECIRENVLTDVLRRNRNEVLGVILEEYDFDRHMEIVREEAWEKAWEEAWEEAWEGAWEAASKEKLKSQIRKNLKKANR